MDEDEPLDTAADTEGRLMRCFLKAVRTRLQYELNPKFHALHIKWLLNELTERSWWLRAERAAWVHQKLSATSQL